MSKKKERNRQDMQGLQADQEKQDFTKGRDSDEFDDEDMISGDEGASPDRSRTDKDERMRELERENKE